MKSSILILDDDLKICRLLHKLLINNNYIAFFTNSVTEAKSLVKYIEFGVILVDYMMPKENGVDFIVFLQQEKINIPTIMVSAIDEVDTKINALTAGVKDYITKPFNSKELLLRINNIISLTKSTQSNKNSLIEFENFSFNPKTNQLLINNNNIELSDTEKLIMNLLATNLNKTLYKENILSYLNKDITEHNLNTLNVTIMRLRKKINLNQNLIKTVRGKGFVLTKD